MVRLNKRILKAMVEEEHETSERYYRIYKKYGYKGFLQASRDEKKHSLYFKKLLSKLR